MEIIIGSERITVDDDFFKNLFFGGFDTPKTIREEKGKSIIDFPESYCVVDTETTGLSPEYDNIIEIGAIKYSHGSEVGRFQSLIQPPQDDDGDYVCQFITELTGITNEMLADAPTAETVIPAFAEFLGSDTIVGYNVSFDVNFLYDDFTEYLSKPLSNNYIDAMRIARKLYPEQKHHRLVDMVKKYSIPVTESHRAMADVEATKQCYDRLYDEAMRQYGTKEAFFDAWKRKYNNRPSLKAADIIGDESKHDPDNPLYERYCVFTGKLDKFSRKEAMQIVADLGGINEDGVTKNTNYLILGNNDYCTTIKDGKSSKQKKAEAYKLKGYDIEIIPETVFYDMLGETYYTEVCEV